MDYDPYMRELLTQLSNRVPLILTINGIETERTDARYVLVFGPRVARTYIRNAGPAITELKVVAAIFEKASGAKKIWEGEMFYVVGVSSSLSDGAIDMFAKEILEQLAKDKVLNLLADSIAMPAVR
ncbi:MAG: hypothetical protein Q7U91_09585 [Sideroxyarcus sp.]|nr:hypothetical protein [Sideroxyarcus sp.]